MPIPHTAWPKPYLLQIYEAAVNEGCTRVDLKSIGMGEAEAKSLILAFYRLRRRSDAQHAAFIKPEYHLVTCTWEPERGTVLVTYSSLPDNTELPPLQAVENKQQLAEPQLAQPLPDFAAELPEHGSFEEHRPIDADAFVQSLLAETSLKIDDEEDDDEGLAPLP